MKKDKNFSIPMNMMSVPLLNTMAITSKKVNVELAIFADQIIIETLKRVNDVFINTKNDQSFDFSDWLLSCLEEHSAHDPDIIHELKKYPKENNPDILDSTISFDEIKREYDKDIED